MDGTYFQKQQLIVALGVSLRGEKMVLGLRQGATENATVVRQLLEGLQERGIDFDVPRLHVLDGGKALQAALRKWPVNVHRFSVVKCTRFATWPASPLISVTISNNTNSPNLATASLFNKFNPGKRRSDYTGWVGTLFTIGSSPMMVTALGRVNVGGISLTHTVELVQASNGEDLAGGS